MKRLAYLIYSLILVTSSSASFGQSENINISAYADFYYAYDYSNPASHQRQYVTQAARHNEFNLNLGFIKADYESDKMRSTLALQAGTYPSANYAGESNSFAQLIQSASIGMKLGENTWLDAGVLGGHFGYEGLLALDNQLYTQALATEYTPYYQTGIQLSTQATEQLAIRAVVVNGWQNIYETNNQKSVGIGIDFSLNDKLTLSYGNYLGKDPVGTQNRTRFHHNFYVDYTDEGFNSAIVIDYMMEGLNVNLPTNTNVMFITWINQLQLTDTWTINGRFEYVDDPTGVLLGAPNGAFHSNIVTIAIRRFISKNAAFSLEGKTYFGKESIWIDRNNQLGSSNNVVTAGITLRLD